MISADTSPRSDRSLNLITDCVTAAFGLWTVISTLVTIAGGNARYGLNAGVLLLIVVACVAALPRIRARWLGSYLADSASNEPLAVLGPALRVRITILLAAALTVGLWIYTQDRLYVWGATVLSCLLATYLGARCEVTAAPGDHADATMPVWKIRVLHGLAILCAAFTLLCVRPRTDDPFYISMSIGIADNPEAPLLALKTIHGARPLGLPLQAMFVPYRAHSFESLGGYLSYLTGIESISVVHFGLATFFGWFAVFAIARFFRVVTPRHWLMALVVTLSYYLIEGSAGRGYANLAFVRMFHGKCALLTAGLPLILAYGIRFGLSPTRWRFGLLALAQVAAMGMSSTGIWLAPILAMLAVVAATPRLSLVPKNGLLSAASSFYVLGIGFWVRSQLSVDRRYTVKDVTATTADIVAHGLKRLAHKMPDMLGNQQTAAALLCVIVAACVLARYGIALRLLALIALFTAGIMANPLLSDFVASSITGALTYERLFWLLPVPLGLGLCVADSKALLQPRLGSVGSVLVLAVALFGFYSVAVTRYVVSRENETALVYPPSLKIWAQPRHVALMLCKHAGDGTTVLASQAVSRGLATVNHCGRPLIAGMRWMSGPLTEVRNRATLQKYVSFPTDVSRDKSKWFKEQLKKYQIAAVAVAPRARGNRRLNELLHRSGFKKVGVVERNQLWALSTAQSVTR